jgi:hypothetical protein
VPVAVVFEIGMLLVATRWIGGGPMAVAVLVLVQLVVLQSASEELLARGWLLQAAGSIMRSPWPGTAVGGAVSTALHVPSTGWGVATTSEPSCSRRRSAGSPTTGPPVTQDGSNCCWTGSSSPLTPSP